MSIKTILKPMLTIAGLAAITTSGVFAQAADTTVNFNVTAGSLTMYAGDAIGNDDICTPSDDATTVELVPCSVAERSVTLSALSVASTRQVTNTTINDILFEDLRGQATSGYSVAATVSDLTASGGKTITLGANPDGALTDADTDAPTLTDNGKLFATLNPSVGSIAVLGPTSAVTGGITNYSAGAKTSVISTTTAVTVFQTTAPVQAARSNIDGVTFKYRVPAFVQTGAYSGTITYTITPS